MKTTIKQLKKELEEANHLMKIHKPSIGFLGSQYYYWANKKNTILGKIKELKYR